MALGCLTLVGKTNPKVFNALTSAHISWFPNVPEVVFVSLNKTVCALSVM
jgi:hypothetical protein